MIARGVMGRGETVLRYAELGLALFAGCVIGWWWGERPDILREFSWLATMTAFGMVGAVVAAIAVPLYQNWDRRREQRREQLKLEWALSEEVYRISSRLCEIGNALQSDPRPQSATEISYFQAQLSAAKAGTADRAGRILIDNLLREVVYLHDEVLRRNDGISNFTAAAAGFHRSPWPNSDTSKSIQRLPAHKEQALHWLERVIHSLEVAGVIVSSAFRISGKATVSFQASGEGRVQSGGSSTN